LLQATKEAARLLHENDMRSQAKVLFEAAFERHPELLTTEDKNLFLDLLLVLEEYQQALEICCRFERLISYIYGGDGRGLVVETGPQRYVKKLFSGC
jgi:hypothetical protein